MNQEYVLKQRKLITWMICEVTHFDKTGKIFEICKQLASFENISDIMDNCEKIGVHIKTMMERIDIFMMYLTICQKYIIVEIFIKMR